MSAIKDLLAKRETEFISIRDLLDQMVREFGGSLDEAARLLAAWLEKPETSNGWVPVLYERGIANWREADVDHYRYGEVAAHYVIEAGKPTRPISQWEGLSDEIPF
jgi:hypothetical protein